MSCRLELRGSARQHPVGAILAGELVLSHNIEVTLVLRRKKPALSNDSLERQLCHAELAERYGAHPADVSAVLAFASTHQLSVLKVDPASRTVTLSGSLGMLASLFGANLQLSKIGDNVCRTRRGHLTLPEPLSGRIVAILGFDQRALAGTFRRHNASAVSPVSYSPAEIAKLYHFPANTGKGQTIALIELGGGYRESDLQTYWKNLGLPEVKVNAVKVNGAQNSPTGDPGSADGEVVLDIEVAGSIAPDAKIAVYFAPNTDAGFLSAINAAIHDKVRKPSVISISWGSAENEWTEQSLRAFNAAFHDAALLGISVCVAAGDNGSSDGEPDGENHVDFPASSPWVLSCGGTRLIATGGQITSETVWNNGTNGGATGGGVSAFFPKPSYQAHVNVPKPTRTLNKTGRGVPDVAGVADPATGYRVFVDGRATVVGGTSAVAPLWAGLIALCNEQLGRNLGWINRTLYTTQVRSTMRDVTSGTNGAFGSAKSWDSCTGLGTPNGEALLKALGAEPASSKVRLGKLLQNRFTRFSRRCSKRLLRLVLFSVL